MQPEVIRRQIKGASDALFTRVSQGEITDEKYRELMAEYAEGLLKSIECLDPHEKLSPGQSEGIDRLYATYPELHDDAFVAANLERWRN